MFEDKHALITGGSRGIGLATAQALANRGWRVSLLARSQARLDEAAATLRRNGAEVTVASADVSDVDQITDAVGQLTAHHGPVDLLVTSAGVTHPGHFTELDDEVFRRMMDVNYFGTLHAIRAVVPSMIERGQGSIVGVSSAAGILGVFGYSAYAASKFAVRGLLESLRQELRPHGIHVACVFPADVDTDMLREEEALKPDETKALAGTVSPIRPEQVADAIVRAIERRRSHVTTDLATGAIDRLIGLARPAVNALLDHKIRGAR